MTKAQLIDKYGQAWYDEQKSKSRERTLQRYHEHPELRQSLEYRREVAARWRSKPENAAKKRAESREYMRAKLAAMTPEERSALARKQYAGRRAKMAVDPNYAAQQMALDKARHDAWREANRDHVNEASRKWRAANPELSRSMVVAAQARRRILGPIDTKLVAWLRKQPCVDCGATEMIEVGHVIPVKLGGTNDPDNLIPQCRSCNRRLSSRPHRTAARNGQKDSHG